MLNEKTIQQIKDAIAAHDYSTLQNLFNKYISLAYDALNNLEDDLAIEQLTYMRYIREALKGNVPESTSLQLNIDAYMCYLHYEIVTSRSRDLYESLDDALAYIAKGRGILPDEVIQGYEKRILEYRAKYLSLTPKKKLMNAVSVIDFCASLGQEHEAIKDYQKLIEENKDDENPEIRKIVNKARKALGKLYIRNSQLDDAAAIFKLLAEETNTISPYLVYMNIMNLNNPNPAIALEEVIDIYDETAYYFDAIGFGEEAKYIYYRLFDLLKDYSKRTGSINELIRCQKISLEMAEHLTQDGHYEEACKIFGSAEKQANDWMSKHSILNCREYAFMVQLIALKCAALVGDKDNASIHKTKASLLLNDIRSQLDSDIVNTWASQIESLAKIAEKS